MYDNRYGADVSKNEPSAEDVERQAREDEVTKLRAEAAERDKQLAAQQARMDQMDRDDSRRFAENRQAAPAAEDM